MEHHSQQDDQRGIVKTPLQTDPEFPVQINSSAFKILPVSQ
jgi:hypothetical protein